MLSKVQFLSCLIVQRQISMLWLQIFIIVAKQATFSEDIKFLTNPKLERFHGIYLIVCRLPKPKSDITLSFFKNRIPNSRINLLSRYHFTILRLKFTISRSNFLSRDRNLLTRDRIYYLEIEIS